MSRKGFTLIELVMVIVILGILAAVAIPRYVNLAGAARESATKGALGAIRAAIAIDYARSATGTLGYPASIYPSMFADSAIPMEKAAKSSDSQAVTVAGDNNGLSTANAAGWYYNSADGLVYVNNSDYSTW